MFTTDSVSAGGIGTTTIVGLIPPAIGCPSDVKPRVFERIKKYAAAGHICSIYGHKYEDVAKPNATYNAYISNFPVTAIERRLQRKCVFCSKLQEYQPADWQDI